MSYISLPKEAAFTPLYSPRTTLSKYNDQIDKLTINLSINIDKYILGFFKDTFDKEKQLPLPQFLAVGKKYLKSWHKDLQDRELTLIICLTRLFQEIDYSKNGVITWPQFNSMLIEKGLNLKSLRNQEPGNTALLKSSHIPGYTGKHSSVIQKMVSLGTKIAIFCEQSNSIQFLGIFGQGSNSSYQQNLKPLILAQQQLIVETTVSKRVKEVQENHKSKHHKEVVKKDLVVAEYKNIILDMIYIHDQKYDMLITSTSDFVVRGWDVSANTPVIARQPENEDEKMMHQFQNQIYCMAWDGVNEILYCAGKSPRIMEWMVKTDSERELFDEKDGHTQMISAMIMMPKLQFLATGDYSGKVILWDTIAQTKKFDYSEHTRSISSMTFHQNLILLFTAAYDHSICVWNPYIGSLIHKILNNVNFIQLDIIPNTNLLICLDAGGCIKIREVNKFTLVSSFSVDRLEKKVDPVCMAAAYGGNQQHNHRKHSSSDHEDMEEYHKAAKSQISQNPIKYCFGGQYINCYQYIHTDSNILFDSYPLTLKHQPSKSVLFCPIKNHIMVWDLLIGQVKTIIRNQCTSEISAFDVLEELNFAVLGDVEGNVQLRKLENGILVKKLHRHKSNVTIILTSESENSSEVNLGNMGSKQYNSPQQEKYIFTASYDGEIAIFQRDHQLGYEFNLVRTVNIKKINANAIVSALSYQSDRHILIIGTNIGQVYFLDVDKNKIISTCTSKAGEIYALVQLKICNVLLCFSKRAEIFGLYLPPHSKKFKPSCHLISEHPTKTSSIAMSKVNNRCYLGSENGDLMSFYLSVSILTGEEKTGQQEIAGESKANIATSPNNKNININNISNSTISSNTINTIQQSSADTHSNNTIIKFSWKISLPEAIKSMIFIQNDSIICAIVSNSIYLIRADNGEIQAELSQQQHSHIPTPILFLNEPEQSIYIKTYDQFIPLSAGTDQDRIRKVCDPYFYLKEVEKHKISLTALGHEQEITDRSNAGWKFQPNLKNMVEDNVQQICSHLQALHSYEQAHSNNENNEKDDKTHHKFDVAIAIQLQKKWQRQKEEEDSSKLRATLMKTWLKAKDGKTSMSMHNLKKISKESQPGLGKLHENSTALFRLGNALRSIDEKDVKALKFVEMAEKEKNKEGVKLPKITKSKLE